MSTEKKLQTSRLHALIPKALHDELLAEWNKEKGQKKYGKEKYLGRLFTITYELADAQEASLKQKEKQILELTDKNQLLEQTLQENAHKQETTLQKNETKIPKWVVWIGGGLLIFALIWILRLMSKLRRMTE
jgi:hypothetical protein